MDTFAVQLIIRMFTAGLCGYVVGFERSNRNKEAGVRTHFIVAMSAALMMIVSKYGFDDIVKFDASRVAAQIVSGIGFLGAGIIFVKNNSFVSGLTTAAGIWATAGVGMAVGAGMYVVGIAATVMIVLAQFLFHSVVLGKDGYRETVTLTLAAGKEELSYIFNVMDINHIQITDFYSERNREGEMILTLHVVVPATVDRKKVRTTLLMRETVKAAEYSIEN
ncbi:MAG: MgtC/SapB family protein [Eubacteriales bacterium]|nr:MgtC/SapB family protein [Eubacteriales bacterium]